MKRIFHSNDTFTSRPLFYKVKFFPLEIFTFSVSPTAPAQKYSGRPIWMFKMVDRQTEWLSSRLAFVYNIFLWNKTSPFNRTINVITVCLYKMSRWGDLLSRPVTFLKKNFMTVLLSIEHCYTTIPRFALHPIPEGLEEKKKILPFFRKIARLSHIKLITSTALPRKTIKPGFVFSWFLEYKNSHRVLPPLT